MKLKVNENFYFLVRYIAEHHKLPVYTEVYEGRHIGAYLYNVRCGRSRISNDDAMYLKRLGVSFEIKNAQEKVHEKLLIAIEFLETYKRRPKSKEVYKGIDIYTFLRNIHTGNTSLSKEDQKNLDEAFATINK